MNHHVVTNIQEKKYFHLKHTTLNFFILSFLLSESYYVYSFVIQFAKHCENHPCCEHCCNTLILISLQEFIVWLFHNLSN